MATFASIFPPGGTGRGTKLSVNAASSSAVINKTRTYLFAINADQDICIAFGQKADAGFTAAANTDFRIPAGVIATWDLGQFDSFAVYNLGSSTANVYYQHLSRA